MIVAVNQPTYLPWLGYFELIARADHFVLLDTVQYAHHGWTNRNRIKGQDGRPVWLTVPVAHAPLDTAIKELRISDDPSNWRWRKKHLGSISSFLGRAPFFAELWPDLSEIVATPWERLCDLNCALILHLMRLLGLDTPVVRASELGLPGHRTELLKNICLHFDAQTYYSPAGASAYLDKEQEILRNAGIALEYQAWQHPVYQQLYGEFLSHMSAIDALMNLGPMKTRALVSSTAEG